MQDVEIHVEDRGRGDPLVLLHGYPGTGADWAEVFDLEGLSQRYRVIAPDARGHGGSTNPSGDFSLRQCAIDLLELLDRLHVERFRAIGMSLGAKTLLHVATRAPERVSSMVLVSATPYFPREAREAMRAAAATVHTPEEWQLMRSRHRHGDAQIEALWRLAGRFAESYEDMSFTPPHLATIRARTLVVNGDRDPLYPVELSVQLYRAIPEASLWIVPGAGHGPIFGDAREPFVRTALAFLDHEDTGIASRT
ncbi:alpha/beta hydrolase family protein [Chondromyces apiculatus DSM 436]|uniref:Alpha/beta hydrolase family protein n=1 Tax=Chondromyces apiculatus DSM 436 TaxID=1192034 RepID=A0A017SWY4_9BACT|nr:alpha/beta hydrolase family protein [Chondromyces apiculatus DSM 436]